MKTKFLILLITMFSLTASAVAQRVVLRASTSDVRSVLTSLERRTDDFKTEMERSFARSNANPPNREDRIMDLIEEFEDSTDRLRSRFNSRGAVDSEINEVHSDAQVINSFMIRNRMSGRAESLWNTIRNDLNTLAGYYSLSWTWGGPIGGQPVGGLPFSGNPNQMRALLRRIENRTDNFKNRMESALDRSRFDTTRTERQVMNYISEFETATDRLRDRFNERRSTDVDASEVLNRGLVIDRFMTQYAFARPAENTWRAIKTDLNTLASYYRVSWDWNRPLPNYPGGVIPGPGRFAALTGTYRLNRARSDNVADVIDRSLSYYESNRRDMVRRNLERRLASPEMIAFGRNGREIEMATSSSARVSFVADGVGRTETNPRGRRVTTTTTLRGDALQIDYTGDRVNDFYVTFDPSGDQLIVTKRIYLENRNDQVTVRSVYDRVNDFADWTAVNAGPIWNGGPVAGGDFYIPNGTRLTATLNSAVTTRGTQIGDRFSMTVNSPGQYRGAVIEGRVVEAKDSGRFTGRANISLDFDTISINGRTYRFAGLIDSVTAINGDRITVNNEGAIRDTSQTRETVTRAGIGAVLGAIIGAIADGGSGAAIGAGIGAGAGAGSVLITGRDDIELGAGSTFSITAYAPTNNRIGAN